MISLEHPVIAGVTQAVRTKSEAKKWVAAGWVVVSADEDQAASASSQNEGSEE